MNKEHEFWAREGGNLTLKFMTWGAIILIIAILLGWKGLDPGSGGTSF